MVTSAADIAHALGGQRQADGSFVVPCPVPGHGKGRGDRNPSLQIADGERRLLVKCYGGCDARDVLDALRRRGLLEGAAIAHSQRQARRPLAKLPDEHEREQRRKASWFWLHREPAAGTIVEAYFRARGYHGVIPPTLAYLPPSKPGHRPAMIAAFGIPDEIESGVLGVKSEAGFASAVHLTLLAPDGSGKAEVQPNKLIIGRPLGRPIVIGLANDQLGLAITEGIEDALTAHLATGLETWAAGAAGFMPSLADAVPSYVECVTIYAHDDPAGQRGATALADKLATRGIEVLIETREPQRKH